MRFNQVYLMLSEDCNLNCKYCFEHKKKNSNMSKSVLDQSFNFIRDHKVSNVILFGGEPTLNNEGIMSCLDNLNNQHIILITNALEVNKDVLNKIKHLKNITVQVSLDGSYETMKDRVLNRDQFKKIIENLKLYQDVVDKNNMCCHMTLTKNNIYSLYENFMFLISLGIKNIQTTLNANDNYSYDDSIIYKSQLEMISDYILEHDDIYFKPVKNCFEPDENLNFCGVGSGFVCINSVGDIYPCPRMYTNFGDIFKMGNIFTGIEKTFDFDIRKNKNNCSECKNNTCVVCVSANLEKYNDINKINDKFCLMSNVNYEIFKNHLEKDNLIIRDNNELKDMYKIYKENKYIGNIKFLQFIIDKDFNLDIFNKIIPILNLNINSFDYTNINFIGNGINNFESNIFNFIDTIKKYGYKGNFSVNIDYNDLNINLIEKFSRYNFNIRINIYQNINNEIINNIKLIKKNNNIKLETFIYYSNKNLNMLFNNFKILNNCGIKNIQFSYKENLEIIDKDILINEFEKILNLYLQDKNLHVFMIDKLIYNYLNNININKNLLIDSNNFSLSIDKSGDFIINNYNIGNIYNGLNFNKINKINKINNNYNSKLNIEESLMKTIIERRILK